MDALGLKPTIQAAAYMAEHIYDYGKDGTINNPIIAGWRVADIPDISPRVGVYIPMGESYDDASEYAIVFRGTDNLGDVANDIKEKFSTNSKDMKEAISFAKQFVKEHRGKEVTFIGHSKGGGEAIGSASETESYAITFNAANFNFAGYGIQTPRDKYKIENYYVEGEWLHEMIGYADYGTTMPLLQSQFHIGEFTSPSWSVDYSKPNAYKNHGMLAVKYALGIK